MKIADLPFHIARDIREALPDHQHDWEFVPVDLFQIYLESNGIIGYTNSIIEAYQETVGRPDRG